MSREDANTKKRAARAARRAAGLCIYCGLARGSRSKDACDYCLDSGIRRMAEVKRARQARGICVNCPSALAPTSRRFCVACLKAHNVRHRAYVAKRLAQRECTYCAGPLSNIDRQRRRKRCQECRAKITAAHQSLRARRVANDQCGTCGAAKVNPIEPCARCRGYGKAWRDKRAAMIARHTQPLEFARPFETIAGDVIYTDPVEVERLAKLIEEATDVVIYPRVPWALTPAPDVDERAALDVPMGRVLVVPGSYRYVADTETGASRMVPLPLHAMPVRFSDQLRGDRAYTIPDPFGALGPYPFPGPGGAL